MFISDFSLSASKEFKSCIAPLLSFQRVKYRAGKNFQKLTKLWIYIINY